MKVYKTKKGYFYKEYKNGKKRRISKEQYFKLKKKSKNISKITAKSKTGKKTQGKKKTAKYIQKGGILTTDDILKQLASEHQVDYLTHRLTQPWNSKNETRTSSHAHASKYPDNPKWQRPQREKRCVKRDATMGSKLYQCSYCSRWFHWTCTEWFSDELRKYNQEGTNPGPLKPSKAKGYHLGTGGDICLECHTFLEVAKVQIPKLEAIKYQEQEKLRLIELRTDQFQTFETVKDPYKALTTSQVDITSKDVEDFKLVLNKLKVLNPYDLEGLFRVAERDTHLTAIFNTTLNQNKLAACNEPIIVSCVLKKCVDHCRLFAVSSIPIELNAVSLFQYINRMSNNKRTCLLLLMDFLLKINPITSKMTPMNLAMMFSGKALSNTNISTLKENMRVTGNITKLAQNYIEYLIRTYPIIKMMLDSYSECCLTNNNKTTLLASYNGRYVEELENGFTTNIFLCLSQTCMTYVLPFLIFSIFDSKLMFQTFVDSSENAIIPNDNKRLILLGFNTVTWVFPMVILDSLNMKSSLTYNFKIVFTFHPNDTAIGDIKFRIVIDNYDEFLEMLQLLVGDIPTDLKTHINKDIKFSDLAQKPEFPEELANSLTKPYLKESVEVFIKDYARCGGKMFEVSEQLMSRFGTKKYNISKYKNVATKLKQLPNLVELLQPYSNRVGTEPEDYSAKMSTILHYAFKLT
jgi:hypothetical protein